MANKLSNNAVKAKTSGTWGYNTPYRYRIYPMPRSAHSVSPPIMLIVGTIYLESGYEVYDSENSTSNFIYSSRTVNALESLAAAVQCSRPLLLEGETCSGKNALIRELAYMCKRKLIVMSMTHETETIRQWLPIPMTVQAGKRRESFYKFCHKILHFIFAV